MLQQPALMLLSIVLTMVLLGQSSNTFNSLSSGNYNIQVREVGNTTCSSTYLSNPVVINVQPVTPTTPLVGSVIQPTCTVATGNFSITNYNSSYVYTITPSSGVTISVIGTANIPVGNYTITASLTTDKDTCTSAPASTSLVSPVCSDIVVTKTDGSSTYTAGGTSTYTITVTNNGPSPATNIVVTDNVPGGVPVANMSWSENGTTNQAGALNNTISSLAVGASVTYTVNVLVPSSFTANVVNMATATGSETDP